MSDRHTVDGILDNISMSLPSKPEYVSVARLTASAIANQMGFNIEEIEDIKIALSEASSNAIRYSCQDVFQVSFVIKRDSLCILIEDKGKGFVEAECREPKIGEAEEGGLGRFIIRSLMDEVQFDTEPGQGTLVRMLKRLEGDK